MEGCYKKFRAAPLQTAGAASLPVRRGQASRSSGATYSPRLPTPIAVLGFGPAPFRNHFDANIPLKRLKPRLQGFLCADEGLKGCRVVRRQMYRQHAVAPALEPDFGSGEDILTKGEAYLMAPVGPGNQNPLHELFRQRTQIRSISGRSRRFSRLRRASGKKRIQRPGHPGKHAGKRLGLS